MSNAIDIQHLSRSFGRTTALDDVSFSVPEGSICGLLGRNGAGKTTVMSIIAGQDRPSSGTATVFGSSPFENAATLAKISYVRDNQRYPDDYYLRHVLRIAPEFAPNWNAAVAEELLEGFRIPTKTAVKKFSRGQLSSVAIVLGLASRAPLTLFDEPYLGLDVTARALFYDVLLRDYALVPRTILLSTHLIEESEALLDHVVILDKGKVVVNADIDEARSGAVIVSGHGAAVERLVAGRTVLHSHGIGALRSVTVAGIAHDPLLDAVPEPGVQVTPATLQELVAAHGANTPTSLSAPDTEEVTA